MRSDELEQRCRLSAFIGDANAFLEYNSLVMLNELTDKLQTAFEDIVVKARAGYWLHSFFYAAIPNDGRYRIPPRSVVGGLEKVEIATTTAGPYCKLEEIPASIEQNYRGVNGSGMQPPSTTCRATLWSSSRPDDRHQHQVFLLHPPVAADDLAELDPRRI